MVFMSALVSKIYQNPVFYLSISFLLIRVVITIGALLYLIAISLDFIFRPVKVLGVLHFSLCAFIAIGLMTVMYIILMFSFHLYLFCSYGVYFCHCGKNLN